MGCVRKPPEGGDVHPQAPAGGGEVARNFLNVVVEWCAAFAKSPPLGGMRGATNGIFLMYVIVEK